MATWGTLLRYMSFGYLIVVVTPGYSGQAFPKTGTKIGESPSFTVSKRAKRATKKREHCDPRPETSTIPT